MSYTINVKTNIPKPVTGTYAYSITVDTNNEAHALVDQIIQRGMSRTVNATTVEYISPHSIMTVTLDGADVTGGHVFTSITL